MLLDKILPPAKVHMIGIGGISMSGLAEILKYKGYIVSGSDISRTHITNMLSDNGIKVYCEHDPKNVENSSAVIYTAAIKKDNPEYLYAQDHNIPLIERSDLLGEITKLYKDTIAISGTHGKTTTTGMLCVSFLENNADPTISIGGELPEIGGNYKIGSSNFLITEACEYVESFLKFFPRIAIVLNVEEDHLDYFRDINHIKSSFEKFLKKIPADGYAVINADDSKCLEITKEIPAKVITFGIKNPAYYSAKNITFNEFGSSFDYIKNGVFIENISVSVPGVHNIYNALACIAVCDLYNLSLEKTTSALKKFMGVKRRFELKGEINQIKIYDDYAHHPSEIKATLSSAKTKKANKVWCVFQPHTYSRTKTLFNEFASSFADADEVIITDIYAAREKDTGEVNSKDLASAINNVSHNTTYMKDFDTIADYLKQHAVPGDIILTMGAGNVFEIGDMLLS